MRIFVDAMGGDLAPQAPVEGTVEALHRNPELTVTLAGIVPEIEKYLAGADDVRSRITLLDAPEVITNHESPVMGVRKKTKSATVLGMLAVRDKEADRVRLRRVYGCSAGGRHVPTGAYSGRGASGACPADAQRQGLFPAH